MKLDNLPVFRFTLLATLFLISPFAHIYVSLILCRIKAQIYFLISLFLTPKQGHAQRTHPTSICL